MQNIIAFIIKNIVFLFLTVTSIIMSIVFYIRSRREKILVYTTNSFNLIHNAIVRIPGLSVKYENNNIENLTLTKIAFWNKGKDTINDNDIAPTDKLSIFPKEDIKILTSVISYKSRDSNNFSLINDKGVIIISFDYIDFHQGVIIDVYHTGHGIESLILKGTVKGGKELHSGSISETYLFDKIMFIITNKIHKPENKLLRLIWAFILASILIIPLIIISPIDKIYKMMNRLPAEFNLSNR
jgi:hypothetical protein